MRKFRHREDIGDGGFTFLATIYVLLSNIMAVLAPLSLIAIIRPGFWLGLLFFAIMFIIPFSELVFWGAAAFCVFRMPSALNISIFVICAIMEITPRIIDAYIRVKCDK